MTDQTLNLIILFLVAAIAVAAVRARKQPLWAEAYRRIRQNRFALLSLLIIGSYTTVGVMDSISWKDNRNAPVRTLLDRVAGRTQERTYSAPFAKETTGEPHEQEGNGSGKLCGDRAGCAKDTSADRVTDDDRETKANPEHAQ